MLLEDRSLLQFSMIVCSILGFFLTIKPSFLKGANSFEVDCKYIRHTRLLCLVCVNGLNNAHRLTNKLY